MNDEKTEMETPENQEEEVVEEEQPSEEVVEPESTDGVDKKQFESAIKQKEHFREKAEKAETERKALEEKLNKAVQSDGKAKEGLDIEDYIDISASLEGLDQREKEYLAREHKLTNKPLSEIRDDEDFQLWQSAYQAKVEKEKTLHPNGTQSDAERPKTLNERLAAANLVDKEKILQEAGLWKSPRPRSDQAHIGDPGLR